MKRSTLFFWAIVLAWTLPAQINYTANDPVTPYEGLYRPGANPGYEPPYSNVALGNIAAGNPAVGQEGVGIRAFRSSLSDKIIGAWGYKVNLSDYQHYASLGMTDNTTIIGFPADWHRETTEYCPGIQAETFANLYTDIWDGGANGTPYNDKNYLAAYVYNVVSTYKDYITFWEIWNEPGLDFTGNLGWRQPGDPAGNWWDRNPQPCEYKLRAPIYHYIRTLRICWEVIKTVDPNAHVVIAGVGYESFLDAVLRNTDNPVDGSVTEEYPYGGGAYFDVMGMHSYPHFDGSMVYLDSSGKLVFERHSDAAARGISKRQAMWQGMLSKHGYDGNTYPKKQWMVTEINLPSQSGYRHRNGWEYYGGVEAQRNFVIKAHVNAMRDGFLQMHFWALAERELEANAQSAFDNMGMYERIRNVRKPYEQVRTTEGVANKTISDALFGTRYDADRTAALQLPAGVDGGAFRQADGDYVYVLWARTVVDQSEAASANYTFPTALQATSLKQWQWDHAQTKAVTTISGNQLLALTATPIILFTGSVDAGGPALLTIGCPANVLTTAPAGQAGMPIDWSLPTVESSCTDGEISLEQIAGPSSGDFLPLGTTELTYRATDGCGNEQECSFLVTIQAGTGDNCRETLPGFTALGNYNGHAYFLSQQTATWPDARQVAETNGGHLVTIDDAQENEFIRSKINSMTYIGLSDHVEEGHLEWSDRSLMPYNNIDVCSFCEDNSPDHDYIVMAPWDGKWSYSHRWTRRPYIVEIVCTTDDPGEPSSLSLDCPDGIVVTAPAGVAGTTVDWPLPDVVSDCATGGLSLEQLEGLSPGTFLPLGTTELTYRATDGCGNVETCSFTVTIEAETAGTCDEDIAGFTLLGSYQNHVYYLSTQPATWQHGRQTANSHGGHLVTINDAQENEFIRSRISSQTYIGLSDEAVEGQPAWSDGTPFNYDNIGICSFCKPNHPDDDYVVMAPWDGKWSFSNRWTRRPYVMEIVCAGARVIPASGYYTSPASLRIFPNPTAGQARLEWQTERDGRTTIRVLTSIGQLLMEESLLLPAGPQGYELDLRQLPAGVYLIDLVSEQGLIWRRKLLKVE